MLTGQAAAAHAGPAIVLSMVLAGIASALAGLCYAEFASTVPIAGSAYTYGYATLGEFVAWIIGWDLILEYALGAATVAVGWSGYLVSILHDFGIQFPAALSAAPGTIVTLADGSAVTAVFNLPAVLITVLVATLLVIGIQESARVNAVIVVVKVAVVLMVIVAGAMFINTANWYAVHSGEHRRVRRVRLQRHPARGRRHLLRLHRIRRGIDGGAGSEEPAEGHADRHSRLAGRLHHPLRAGLRGDRRPRALHVARRGRADGGGDRRGEGAGGAARRGRALFNIMPFLVKLGAIAGLSSVMVVMMLGQTRVFFSMANDGLLPSLGEPRAPEVPHAAHHDDPDGHGVAIAAGFTPINILGELVSIGTLLAFVIVSIGIMVLRIKRPDLNRPFRTPAVFVVAPLAALVSLGADGRPAAGHVAAADHLDGARRGRLLPLRLQSQQAARTPMRPPLATGQRVSMAARILDGNAIGRQIREDLRRASRPSRPARAGRPGSASCSSATIPPRRSTSATRSNRPRNEVCSRS